MSKLHLHIGTYKTGTSSIQSFLTQNRKNLLQKGYLYPTSGTRKSSHGRFCQTILSRRPYSSFTNECIEDWKNLEREIDLHRPTHIVISHEAFSTFERDEVKLLESYLSRCLSGFKIEIIIYLRRQDDLLKSLYGTRIKGAQYWGSLMDFYEEKKLSRNGYTHGEHHVRDFRFDYYELLKPWAETFGQDNIVVRNYEKAKKDLLNDFLEAIDLSTDEDWQYLEVYQNRASSGKTIKLLKLLNYIARVKLSMSREECQNFTRTGKTRKIVKLIERLPEFIFSNELASDKQLHNVLENFEDANRKVAQHYLGQAKLF